MNKKVKLSNKKEAATAYIHTLSHDGRGIATVNNKTTFISGALPQEQVTYRITHQHNTYHQADIMDIIQPSPQRITPPCLHFGICGGCSLQHMSTETQLQLKQETLLTQLKHFGQVEPEHVLTPLNVTDLGYRHKARLGVKFVIKKNKVLIGFREKSSRYLADLQECIVLHPEVGQRLTTLSKLIASLECYRSIPQIEVAIGDVEVALVFRHLVPLSDKDKEQLLDFGKEHRIHIYLQPNQPAKITKLWPQDESFRLHYTLPDYQLEYFFHPLDFTQINLQMNRLMIKQALTLLDLKNDDRVLDLFCGIGNFTLPMAKYANHVTGVEGNADMIARAKDNASHNNIQNVDFHTANLMEPLTQATWMKQQYSAILLDPPRTGAKEILTYIDLFGAQKIVYVSCNPATLARDAGELVHQYGYNLKKAGIMNMFPHTSHVEAMAIFIKK